VETPDFIHPEPPPLPDAEPYDDGYGRAAGVLPGLGDRLTWITGLVLAVSSFTGWYMGSGAGLNIAVTGWHTGVLGKLVFVIGLALIALVVLREAGIELPASVPGSLVVVALGTLATIFVLVRVIWIPEDVLPADGRDVGLFISLVAALAAIGAGIVRASEEM
jgi:hypothetical protein